MPKVHYMYCAYTATCSDPPHSQASLCRITATTGHLEGASKYSVPLMTTRCAGVFTPHASVLVATSTYKRASNCAYTL